MHLSNTIKWNNNKHCSTSREEHIRIMIALVHRKNLRSYKKDLSNFYALIQEPVLLKDKMTIIPPTEDALEKR